MGEPFGCVVTDPPWPENGGGKIKRGADRHYKTMPVRDIIALHAQLFDGTYAFAENTHLWVWCTMTYLFDGRRLLEALGFRYVSNKVWVKAEEFGTFSKEGGAAFIAYKPQKPGLGQYHGGQHEHLLLGVRGVLPALWKDKASGAKRPGSVIYAPRGRHSEKPQAAYEHFENTSPGPRLELFYRGAPRRGWAVWGDEVAVEGIDE
jgi:N6-adenosine-specific RNA methylase IME4